MLKHIGKIILSLFSVTDVYCNMFFLKYITLFIFVIQTYW